MIFLFIPTIPFIQIAYHNYLDRKYNYMQSHQKRRWISQLEVAMSDKQCKEEYYQILNFEEALNSLVAMIELKGPLDSPYEGYSFLIEYAARPEFPHKAPNVKFITIPCHPFVCPKTGKICCDIFTNNWSPSLTICTVLLSIISLLSETKLPEDEPGLNMEAAAEMSLKYSQFFKHAALIEKQNNIKNEILYKKIKSSINQPEDLIKQDKKFLDKKKAFLNDPKMKKKYEEKMEIINEKKHKQ